MRNAWTREELQAALNLYCRLPFGRLHRGNPEIIALAEFLGRTPSALAMKLVNFASLDPLHQNRNVKGLSNTSYADRAVWDEFRANPEKFAFESQQLVQQLSGKPFIYDTDAYTAETPTEAVRMVRVRLVQNFFRESVLSSYGYSCAICQMHLPEMLNASHIIPWSVSVELRADPCNGLSLCTLHDRAFDRGLLTLDDALRVVVSDRVRQNPIPSMQKVGLVDIENQSLHLPTRFSPNLLAIAYHREHVFA